MEHYLRVWKILYYIDYDEFLEIAGFDDDYYGEEKWVDWNNDYAQALLNYDSVVLARFSEYVDSKLKEK